MNYELAKRLKDAGFPQKDGPLWIPPDRVSRNKKGCYITGGNLEKLVTEGNTAYSPTLSELIEACGDAFQSLKHGRGRWSIYMPNRNHNGFEEVGFSTPEEAVSNLWLSLKEVA